MQGSISQIIKYCVPRTYAVSFINNKGNLKDVLKDLGSKDNLKNLALTMITAGLTTKIAHGGNWILENGQPYKTSLLTKLGLKHGTHLEYFARKATIGALQGGITELRGGSFKDGFVGSFAGSYLTKYGPSFGNGSINAAIYGGLASELGGGEFKDGALSAFLTDVFNRQLAPKEQEYLKENIDKIREIAEKNGVYVDNLTDIQLHVLSNQAALLAYDLDANLSAFLFSKKIRVRVQLITIFQFLFWSTSFSWCQPSFG